MNTFLKKSNNFTKNFSIRINANIKFISKFNFYTININKKLKFKESITNPNFHKKNLNESHYKLNIFNFSDKNKKDSEKKNNDDEKKETKKDEYNSKPSEEKPKSDEDKKDNQDKEDKGNFIFTIFQN